MIEIKSDTKLPFIFKDCKSGFLIEDGKTFVNGEYKQSLTDLQFASLKRFSTLEKAKAIAMPTKKEIVAEKQKQEKKEEEIKVKTNILKNDKKGKK